LIDGREEVGGGIGDSLGRMIDAGGGMGDTFEGG